jgi:hypothetical protein
MFLTIFKVVAMFCHKLVPHAVMAVVGMYTYVVTQDFRFETVMI